MPAINLLTATRARNFFSSVFKTRNGVNNLMTIDDGNNIIDGVNILAHNMSARLTVDFNITTTGVGDDFTIARKSNDQCWGEGSKCPQDVGNPKYKCYSCPYNGSPSETDLFNIVVVGPGTYTLTVTPPSDIIFTGSDIVFGNAPNLGLINVDRVSNFVYTVTVYDFASGAPLPTSGFLNNTLLTVLCYPAKQSGGWIL